MCSPSPSDTPPSSLKNLRKSSSPSHEKLALTKYSFPKPIGSQYLHRDGDLLKRPCDLSFFSRSDSSCRTTSNTFRKTPWMLLSSLTENFLRPDLTEVSPPLQPRFCPEVFVGEQGHLIRTCHGYRRRAKNQVHEWIDGSLEDILVSVEAFHLHNMFQDIIKHDQRFDFDRISAVLELCFQAGANIYDENLCFQSGANIYDENLCFRPDTIHCGIDAELNSAHALTVAIKTLDAWERMRSGVQRLLLVYPAKVCKYCSEVHVGPSGHKARLCGVFKHESWRGNHIWEKAEVDNLVPPKIVWRKRTQDPPILSDQGRDYYGHAPAVVELCVQAGAIVPKKYSIMMKVHGLGPPP